MDTAPGRRQLTLEVEFDGDTICGSVDAGGDGGLRPFHGWLEFGRAIEDAYEQAAQSSAVEERG